MTVIWDQRKSFGAAFFILFIMLVIASSGMYLVEKDVQPEKFGSIPKAMWWSIVSLTTVGYGDVYPVTSLGKNFWFYNNYFRYWDCSLTFRHSSLSISQNIQEEIKRNMNKKLEFVLQDKKIDIE